MKKMSTARFVFQKVVLGLVAIACTLSVFPLIAAIIESVKWAPAQGQDSLLKSFVAELFAKNV
jgi:hypothetical protein